MRLLKRRSEVSRTDAVVQDARQRAAADYQTIDRLQAAVFVVGNGRVLLDNLGLTAEQARVALLDHWGRDDEVATRLRIAAFSLSRPPSSDASAAVPRDGFRTEDDWSRAAAIFDLTYVDELVGLLLRNGIPGGLDQSRPIARTSRPEVRLADTLDLAMLFVDAAEGLESNEKAVVLARAGAIDPQRTADAKARTSEAGNVRPRLVAAVIERMQATNPDALATVQGSAFADCVESVALAVLGAPWIDVDDLETLYDPFEEALPFARLMLDLEDRRVDELSERLGDFGPDLPTERPATRERANAKRLILAVRRLGRSDWSTVATAILAPDYEHDRVSTSWKRVEAAALNNRTPNCGLIQNSARGVASGMIGHLQDEDDRWLPLLGFRSGSEGRNALTAATERAAVALFAEDLVDREDFDLLVGPFKSVVSFD